MCITLNPEPDVAAERFIVRLYDGFDYCWTNVTGPVTKEEAGRIWNEKTDNGKKNTKYDDIDYYAIFPADVKMLYAAENFKS